MIDFHTHTLFSDGELLLTELVRRAQVRGYRVIGISDHVDASNLDFVVPRGRRAADELRDLMDIKVAAGAEITHCPPAQIKGLVASARDLGAQYVIVHGETLSEPVMPGTNHAAIEAGCDIVAHPGLIDENDVALAAQKDVHLEISARRGHCLANGHVAALAGKHGAKLLFGSDSHESSDLVECDQRRRILRGAGMTPGEVDVALRNAESLAARIFG